MMRTAIGAVLSAALLLTTPAPALSAATCTLDRATGTTIAATPFIQSGYGAQWNAATHRIAFMRPDSDGYYRLFLIRPDGSGLTALSEGHGNLPPGHRGTPYWFPSGRYLLFTAQQRDWHGGRAFGIPGYGALPGWGLHDDLWVMEVASGRAWQLTDTHAPNSYDQGVLIPIVAPNGRLVAWSARQPDHKYKILVADFDTGPTPHLSNIRSYEPGGPAYYETGSFSSDSRSLFYTSDQDTHSFWKSQIYRLDLTTGRGTRLTQGNTYNEHPAVVATPAGDWVVFMSTQGERRRHLRLGTDWWAMRPDGSGLKRLTTMNLAPGDNPENTARTLVAGKVTADPRGGVLLGDVQDSLVRQTGFVERIQLTCPGSTRTKR